MEQMFDAFRSTRFHVLCQPRHRTLDLYPLCGNNDHNWQLWSIKQSCNSYRLCHEKLGKLVLKIYIVYIIFKGLLTMNHAYEIKMTRQYYKHYSFIMNLIE